MGEMNGHVQFVFKLEMCCKMEWFFWLNIMSCVVYTLEWVSFIFVFKCYSI